MKQTSSELKSIAKGKLRGQYGLPMGAMVLVTLTVFIISIASSFIFFRNLNFSKLIIYYVISILNSMIFSILSVGLCSLFLDLCREKEYSLSNVFFVFRNNPGHAIGLIIIPILMAIACFIILLVVSGCLHFFFPKVIGGLIIILCYIISIIAIMIMYISFSQVFFIYIDDPYKGVLNTLKESSALMKGNKARYFYLQISFLGLFILSIFSCYIGLLWIGPYYSTTQALFYQDLRNEL